MRKLRIARYVVPAVIVVGIGVQPLIAINLAQLADQFSPVVRDAMDSEIVSGQRPRIVKLGNMDVEDLVANPRVDADLVMFKFIVDHTTLSQRKILVSWLDQGNNRILLTRIDMKLYGPFFGVRGNYHSRPWVPMKLADHAVNTDCIEVKGNMDFDALPEGSEIIAYRAGKPSAGRFMHGKTEVYFYPDVRGNDKDRWLLNFYHWALGIDVPGPATDLLKKRMSEVRTGEGAHDSLTLRSGDVIKGVLGAGDYKLQTLDGTRSFKTKEIAEIILEFTKDKQDKIELRDGKEFTGTLLAADFEILSGDGKPQSFSRETVKVIRYNVPGDTTKEK